MQILTQTDKYRKNVGNEKIKLLTLNSTFYAK